MRNCWPLVLLFRRNILPKMLALCTPLPDALAHVANVRFVAILIFDRSGIIIPVICWAGLL